MCKRIFQKSKGFGTIEVMIAVALLAVVTMGISSLLTTLARSSQKANINSMLSGMRNRMQGAVQNPNIWRRIIQDARNNDAGAQGNFLTNMHLLNVEVVPPGPITRDTVLRVNADNVQVLDAGGNPVSTLQMLNHPLITTEGVFPIGVYCDSTGAPPCYDSRPTAPGAMDGFSATGVRCNTYNPTPGAGDDRCPFRMEMYWAPRCSGVGPGLTCTHVGAAVWLRMFYNPGPAMRANGYVFNAANYGFDALQLTMGNNDHATACNQIGGVWDGDRCVFNPRISCARGQKMVGILNDGTYHCVDDVDLPGTPGLNPDPNAALRAAGGANNDQCPAGLVAVRLRADGRPDCDYPLEKAADDPAFSYSAANTYEDATRMICRNGYKVKKVNRDGTVFCALLEVSASPYANVNTDATNRFVCNTGFKVKSVNPDGTVECQPLEATGSYANDNTSVDRFTCATGFKVKKVNTDGTVECQPLEATGSYTNANTSGNRFTCATGYKVKVVNPDGSVECALMENAGGFDNAGADGTRRACLTGYKVDVVHPDGTVKCTRNLAGGADGCDDPNEYVTGYDANGNAICEFHLDNTQCPNGRSIVGYDDSGQAMCRYTTCPEGWSIYGFDAQKNPRCQRSYNANWSYTEAGACNNCNRPDLAWTDCPQGTSYVGETRQATDMWFDYPGACTGVSGFNSICTAGAGAASAACALRRNPDQQGVHIDCVTGALWFVMPWIDTGGGFQCRHRFTRFHTGP